MNIERMFYEEVRDKKRTGSGSFHKKGKGVKHGMSGVKLGPYDFMTKKQKEALNGEVILTSLYDNLITYEQFKSLSDDKMKTYLEEYRARFSNKMIMEHWGVPQGSYYKLVNDLGIETNRKMSEAAKKNTSPRRGRQKVDNQPETKLNYKNALKPYIEETTPQLEMEVVPTQQAVVIPKQDGMQFNFSGIYEPKAILSKLDKLSLLLSDEENKFDIKIFIQETEHKIENVG